MDRSQIALFRESPTGCRAADTAKLGFRHDGGVPVEGGDLFDEATLVPGAIQIGYSPFDEGSRGVFSLHVPVALRE